MKYKYKYRVTKKFISGLLKGITIRQDTDVEFQLGKNYGEYVVIGIYVYDN